jgi:hypothetical protein
MCADDLAKESRSQIDGAAARRGGRHWQDASATPGRGARACQSDGFARPRRWGCAVGEGDGCSWLAGVSRRALGVQAAKEKEEGGAQADLGARPFRLTRVERRSGDHTR